VLEHRPPNLHLILAGRSVPALPLARLRARGQLVELRAADLRCTRAEATIFLRDHMQLTLPPDALTTLASRTEGWIAGLHLAALAVQGAADGLGVVHALNGTQELIRDYLIDEVFDQQPATIQQFLLQTAILERLNAPLCDALLKGSAPTRSSDSQSALTYLEQANLFLVPLDEERRWCRYHPLFAEALRARLAQTQPAQVADLHRRAAAWYAGEGLDTEAIAHALTAGDHVLAARLVEEVADCMVQVNGGTPMSYTYNAANEVSNTGWTYDNAGNLIGDGTATYSYDALNRTKTVTAGSQTRMNSYNGDGVLVTQVANGTTTRYTQDLASPLSQVLQTTQGSATTNYLYGAARLASLTGSTRTWYAADALGSVRRTLSDTGTPLGIVNYDPWGTVERGQCRSSASPASCGMALSGRPM
jgi:hypothetical protein